MIFSISTQPSLRVQPVRRRLPLLRILRRLRCILGRAPHRRAVGGRLTDGEHQGACPRRADLVESNYTEWRCFFDAFISKFGLGSHLSSPPTADDRRDRDWIMKDQCILRWLYNSVSKDVHAIVRVPRATAYSIWNSIYDQFRDNQLHRAVYLEAEFQSLMQGDMDITAYTGHLKRLADALRDVGQPVRETSQVLNMLRGLSPKYRHAVPVITAKNPPHTFLSVRSYLLLEEQYDREHSKATQQHALVATGAGRAAAPQAADGSSSSAPKSAPHAPATAPRPDRGPRRGRGRGRGPPGGSSSGAPPRPSSPAWTPGLNPWTCMVQAWPMPFRVPGAGVLGSRPGAPAQQAFYAGAAPSYAGAAPPIPGSAPPPSSPDVWNHQAMLAALATSGVPSSGPQATEWFLDTSATSHMASNAGPAYPHGDPPM
ncbi:uncharacterized protein [Miscanthus floridulus]|uniref:uncharacterized protein n=1 Tax=Miscanthus floridulus TaxID=154761 RepID=UPI003458322F